MTLMYNDIESDEREFYADIIRQNIISGILDISEYIYDHRIKVIEKNRKTVRKIREGWHELSLFDEITAKGILKLWKDPVVSEIIQDEHTLYRAPHMQYFMDMYDQIIQKDYIPSDEDIIRSRQKTTGTLVANFEFDDVSWVISDVGGQLSERKKWRLIISQGMRIIFFLAANEYNVISIEDPSTTKYDLAMEVFKKTAESMITEGEQLGLMIIFLNKIDLFEEKIRTEKGYNDFYEKFPKFRKLIKKKKNPTEEDFEEISDLALTFIEELMCKSVPPEIKLVFHRTCALDKESLKLIISSVRTTVLENIREDAGIRF
eukprot:TRINITY_DN2443_c1_g1_i2.p1 TRINITY_DN2443_c1_g1~~TRINITY_DN2443_c1_g1_i2.p1  ORF type:complete len:318 (+),score=81.57 TRINITY_DN2443_c1_g1_i2:152-1105(+)